MATHVSVSEPSTFYELPEGRRGIFVGGGASVRVAGAIYLFCIPESDYVIGQVSLVTGGQ